MQMTDEPLDAEVAEYYHHRDAASRISNLSFVTVLFGLLFAVLTLFWLEAGRVDNGLLLAGIALFLASVSAVFGSGVAWMKTRDTLIPWAKVCDRYDIDTVPPLEDWHDSLEERGKFPEPMDGEWDDD
jgi:hypothetical protein